MLRDTVAELFLDQLREVVHAITIERLTLRYRAAYDTYQGISDTNRELAMTGGTPTLRALVDEERAFEQLDAARHALLAAAARAYPTIH